MAHKPESLLNQTAQNQTTPRSPVPKNGGLHQNNSIIISTINKKVNHSVLKQETMNSSYLDKLIQGMSLGGFLEPHQDGSDFKSPGYVNLEQNGQLAVRLIEEESSPMVVASCSNEQFLHDDIQIKPPHLPKVWRFRSVGGDLTLIQTDDPQIPTQVPGMPAEIVISPRYAVSELLEGNFWEKPIEMRAEIGGLSHWMHDSIVTRPIRVNLEKNTVRALETLTVKITDYADTSFNISDGSELPQLNIRTEKECIRAVDADEIVIRFKAMVEVVSSSGLTWSEAIETLQEVQELVNLLSWHSFRSHNLEGRFRQETASLFELFQEAGFSQSENMISDVGSWAKIFNRQFPIAASSPESKQQHNFILPFTDFDEQRLKHWLKLRREKAHSFGLFKRVLDEPRMSPPVKALQLGAGLESLGYKLKETETSKRQANSTKAEELFRIVATSAQQIFPNSFDEWPKQANDVYQAMKHLRRTLPALGEIARINDRTTLVLQIWLADQLGASPESIRKYVSEQTRYRSKYVKIPDPSELGRDW